MRERFVRDGAIAALFVAVALVELLASSQRRGPLALDLLAFLAAAALLAVRRRAPLTVAYAFFALALVRSAFLTPTSDSASLIFALMLVAFTAGREVGARPARIALLGGLAAVVGVDALEDQLTLDDILFPFTFFVGMPWLLGRMIRARTFLARELQERNARLEAERERSAVVAAQEERRRIARELHDVVAHSLSVMVVQAGAGRRVAPQDPAQAAECARLVERVGRDALAEMRRLLGVMKPAGEPAERAPQPGLGAVVDLVARTRAAGLPVELQILGDARALPSGLDLAAYRIVQEALTNAIKHAGPAHARVVVTWRAEELELEVSDDGRGAGEPASGGHGLVGMRERTALYGGELQTGRARGGGFRVHARFPLPVREPVPA